MSPRKTKIVATIGPSTSEPEKLEALIRAGVDVFRLNFSHGTREEHRKVIRALRALEKELETEVGVLQDLCGPKIRLGQLPAEGVTLRAGSEAVLVPGETAQAGRLPVKYEGLLEDVRPGDPILLADGTVELEVVDRKPEGLVARVVCGGVLSSHKGVNLPASRLKMPAFTEKDRRDLEVGLEEGVDFVALSFVRDAEDIEPVARRLADLDRSPLLIAKIEKPQAVERLEEILEVVNGVMVARGDLGVEMPAEEVPLIQKRIIQVARCAAKPVITATQMLRSMVDSSRPTRAETSDVANAILDGTDAVMLSEETAVGNYPVEAVRALDRIARGVEPHLSWENHLEEPLAASISRPTGAISRAVCWLARDVGARLVAAPTSSGGTARMVARFRPSFRVLGLSTDPRVRRQLRLSWGVEPRPMPPVSGTDELFQMVRTVAAQEGLKKGQPVVVTAGIPLNVPGTTNLVHLLEV